MASRFQVESCAAHAMTSHGIAAHFHSKFELPAHREASKAHAYKEQDFKTILQDHRKNVIPKYPPSDNIDAFEWHAENLQQTKRYCASRDDADEATDLLREAKRASIAGDTTLANEKRKEALELKPYNVSDLVVGGSKPK